MMKLPYVLAVFLAVLVYICPVSAQMSKLNSTSMPDARTFAEIFQKGPGRDFSTGPLGVWNDLLTEEQVRSMLRDLVSQNLKQVWITPRSGTMTPYLSDEWFARWREALDEAEKLDMNLWIYDEDYCPSGFAGGLVPDALPDSRGMGLCFEEIEHLDKTDASAMTSVFPAGFGEFDEFINNDNFYYVFELLSEPNVTATGYRRIQRDQMEVGKKYIVGKAQYVPASSQFAGKWYVDLLKKGVTEKFIEITFDAYKQRFSDQFGRRIPGIFTDEPHLAGLYVRTWVTWNAEIPQLFEEKFGYSLIDHLPSLYKPVGNWKKVRHNYHALLLELFAERWGKFCFEWCEANNLEFTGHYWEHEWGNTSFGPDNMAMYIWHQRPCIDILTNQYSEKVNAQFGSVRAVKETSSVMNQMGRARGLCELYGSGGWDLRFEDMKRQADWLLVLGVNTINEHLSHLTIRGARKRDHPQSFSYHASWWPAYHIMANRNARLQYALSQGKQVNRILVIEPTTTTWMYQGEIPDIWQQDDDTTKLGNIKNSFHDFVNDLEKANVEYDLGSEDTMRRVGAVNDGSPLAVGQAVYDIVVLPQYMENIESSTLNLLASTAKRIKVYYFEEPQFVNGATPIGHDAQRLRQLFDSLNAIKVESEEEVIRLCKTRVNDDGFHLDPDTEPASGNVYHHRRRLGDQEVVFIANVSITESSGGWVYSTKHDVEKWCLDTGKQTRYPYELSGNDWVKFRYELPPCGSLLVVLSEGNRTGYATAKESVSAIPPKSEMKITRLEPNVLAVDYMDITIKDETRKDVYFHRANQWVFEKNGKEIDLFQNPWEYRVQFKDELITMKFPDGSGFTATYKFTIRDQVPGDLAMVIERADLYEITCNGKSVNVDTEKWWLDKSFYKLELSGVAQIGENLVSITAKPMTIYHELEPAYLLGDFSLESAEHGFVVCPPKQLQLCISQAQEEIADHTPRLELVEPRQGWNRQGMPFYSHGVAYSTIFDLPVMKIGERVYVKLSDSPMGWYGAVAKVMVNGKEAGHIGWAPWKLDVSEFVKQGENTIDVIVIGTPKNLLGPHHAGKLRGSGGPWLFGEAPTLQPSGDCYDTIGYGLFENYELQITNGTIPNPG